MAIDLAREAEFALGDLAVRPSRREVSVADVRTVLEPRVMQVLVALARRQGEVVSRDELIADCWDGRIVGDDSINTCVSKVRRLAERTGAYAIETIPRVGYRLSLSGVEVERGATGSEEVLLAVLPFDNLSGDPDLGWFSDGVSEEILHSLAQRGSLKVIGRSSSFQFRGADKAVAKVARELGATHVLDGSVRRQAGRTRISAQLIECATQTTVWADRVERDMADVLELQDDVAAAVARALRSVLAPAVRRGFLGQTAHELFLQAATRPNRVTPESLRRQLAQLEEVVRQSPEFAEAWGAIGYARALLADYEGADAAAPTRRSAREAAAHALSLDPRCATAARAMARTFARFGPHVEHERWLAQAVEWAPGEAVVHRDRARQLASVGRMAEALTAIQHAHSLDPLHLDTVAMLGRGLFEVGRLGEADEVLARAMARWPAFEVFPGWLMFVRLLRSGPEDARAVLAGADLGSRGRGNLWFVNAYAEGSAAAERAVASVERTLERSGRVDFFVLALLAELGAGDSACDIATRANLGFPPPASDSLGNTGYNQAAFFMRPFPAIRRTPRFAALCERVGLVDYWLATDAWPDCVEEVAPYYDFKAECRRVAAAR